MKFHSFQARDETVSSSSETEENEDRDRIYWKNRQTAVESVCVSARGHKASPKPARVPCRKSREGKDAARGGGPRTVNDQHPGHPRMSLLKQDSGEHPKDTGQAATQQAQRGCSHLPQRPRAARGCHEQEVSRCSQAPGNFERDGISVTLI